MYKSRSFLVTVYYNGDDLNDLDINSDQELSITLKRVLKKRNRTSQVFDVALDFRKKMIAKMLRESSKNFL